MYKPNNIKKSKKGIIKRFISFLVVVVMLITAVPTFALNVFAATDSVFKISIKWNGNNQNPNNYNYSSASPESQLVRLKIIYENKEVSNGYSPGEMVITVPGIRGAIRNGSYATPVGIAADRTSAGTNNYDWSYTYSSANDTYTFVNNHTISPNSTFEGSFEIIWSIPSRDSYNNYSKSFQAKFRSAKNEKAESNIITYTQSRQRDTYTLRENATPLYGAEGLTGALPAGKNDTDYTWVKYNISGSDKYLARDVNGAERFECFFLEGAIVQGAGLVKTGQKKVIDGKTYECWSVSKNITSSSPNPYLQNVFVAYPNDRYDKQIVTNYVELKGTYVDESTESLLATTQLAVNLLDYNYSDLTGNVCDVSKYSYGVNSNYINSHCSNCRTTGFGGISGESMRFGSREYLSTFKCELLYRQTEASYYDLEFVDDIMDVDLKNGKFHQLGDDEYSFTKAYIPANTSILNINNLPVQANKYNVEIYVRRAGGTFETTPYSTTKISQQEQNVHLPANTVGVKIVIRGVNESFRFGTDNGKKGVGVYYKFHTSNEEIRTDAGRHINNMYFKLYREKNNVYEWANDEYDGNRSTYDTQREFDRDMELYGHTFDREKANLHILETPNEFSIQNTIEDAGEDSEAYFFKGGITTKFSLLDDNSLSKFSMYTMVPKGLRLDERYNTPARLLEVLDFWSPGISSEYLADHVSIEIIENYKGSGQQYIAFNFNFIDAPIRVSNVNIRKIPMYVAKDTLTQVSNQYTMQAMALTDQGGKWYATSWDNQGGVWKDIDRDGNTSEVAAVSTDFVKIFKPESSSLQMTKSVKTGLSNDYVQPIKNVSTGEYVTADIPETYHSQEYSYKLRLRTGANKASNIVFYDAIETGSKMQWQGNFVRVDTSAAEKKLGAKPTIYYSTEVETFDPKPNTSTGNWTTKKPSVVRSIAVDFGKAVLNSGQYLYIELIMKAPANPNKELNNKLTENGYFTNYDKLNDSGQFLENQYLPSNFVPVRISPHMGTIALVKKDEISGALLKDAKFDLYRMVGDTPNGTADTLVSRNLVTNSRGRLSVRVAYGNYYFKEVSAPLGYLLKTEIVMAALDDINPELSIEIEVTNTRKEGQFTVRKTSDRRPDLNLQGAKFSVYSSDGTLVQDGNDPKYGLVTGENGEMTVNGLPWGDYYLLEIQSPYGYIMSTKKYNFTVKADTDAGRLDGATVVNTQIPAEATLTKFEVLEDGNTQTNIVLDGAVYELFDAKTNKKLGSYMTDELGKIYVDDLTFGSYYFKESIPAQGYELYPNKVPFVVDADHTKVALEVVTTDTRLTGKVWLQKTDDGGKTVKNAEFGLFSAVTNKRVGVDGQESTAQSYTTDEEGSLSIEGIYWGEYYVQEIKAPTGYVLSDKKYPVTVNRETVNDRIMIHATNERKKGIVELTKVDEADETKKLEGAVFTLYRSDGTQYRDDLTTGADGKLLVGELEWGSYYFSEKVAPAGYGLNPEKIRFSVNYLTGGVKQEIMVTDPKISCELTINKRIKISDIVFAHGNPTFTFRIEGVELDGLTKHTFYRTLSFDQKYVNAYQQANPNAEFVELSTIFTGLPMGTYTVTEVKTVRYDMNGVEILFGNGTVGAENVVFEFDSVDNLKGTTRFTNDKTKQSSTNHTSQQTNIIKRERKLTAIVALWNGPDVIQSEILDRKLLDVFAIYDDGVQEKLGDNDYDLDPETFDSTMNGEYTIKATFTEQGRTRDATFDLFLGIPPKFTWEVLSSAPYVHEGITYDGTAKVTGYYGSNTVLSIPKSVNGINTASTQNGVLKMNFTDNGKNYCVVEYNQQATFKDTVAITTAGWAVTNQIFATNSSIKDPTGKYVAAYNPYSDKKLWLLTSDNKTTKPYDGAVNWEAPAKVTWSDATSLNPTIYMRNAIVDFVLPSGLTTIGERAFLGHLGLSGNLTIPDTVEHIGMNAFLNSSNLKGNLKIGNKVKSIGSNAFKASKFVGTLSLGNSLENIGDYAFQNSTFSGALTIPDSVKVIGNGAFRSCENFTGQLTIGNSVETIGTAAFSTTSFSGDLIIPDSVSTISYIAFQTFKLSGNLTVGNGVTSMGLEAFKGSTLNGLTLKEGLTFIGESAFLESSVLKGDLIIPDSVSTIGAKAFSNSKLPGKVTIGSGVTSMGAEAFISSTLTGLTLKEGMTSIGEYAFNNCTKLNGDLIIPGSIKVVSQYAFNYCKGLTGAIRIGDGVLTIEEAAFRYNTNVSSIELGNTLQTIENAAFAGINGFTGTSITIPENVVTIGPASFSNFWGYNLKTVYIPAKFSPNTFDVNTKEHVVYY